MGNMGKTKCHIVNCGYQMGPDEVTYIKVFKPDGKTLDGHRPVCKSCLTQISKYKKKITTKFIYG